MAKEEAEKKATELPKRRMNDMRQNDTDTHTQLLDVLEPKYYTKIIVIHINKTQCTGACCSAAQNGTYT